MLNPDKLARLNQLSKIAKAGTLSVEETIERQDLRQEYLSNFRNSMKSTIENTRVIDPNGNDVTPQKVKDRLDKKKMH
ncbi:DUF896 domain-containing protein [Bacillus sp. 2205SS5-2]|uniref:DUF896 domain-containing protein n=1 Tax=Bacillus sp. 2205SS5-2 TaxID=3109031 RepID=UPI0030046B95